MSAKRTRPSPTRRSSGLSGRLRVLMVGLAIGAAWGVVMCVALWLLGHLDGDDVFGWVYRIVTPALIGMVVATVMAPRRPPQQAGGGTNR